MSAISITADTRCDLIRLERTNMVTKMEDRIKIDLLSLSNLILDHLKQCDPDSLPHTAEMIGTLAVQFNQGALLQYQYGAIERAEVLCRSEIELFAELSSVSPHRALCQANMVAPYINPGCIRNAILLLRVCSNGTRNEYWYTELQRLASTTLFRLERACAYWELGGEFLQHSYDLYRSVPFVDSKQSSETVAFLLRQLPARSMFSGRMEDAANASIDAVFDALMDYVPA